MLIIGVALLLTAANVGTEAEYRPGGAPVRGVWDRFYAGDHEPELPMPLIKAGRKMTPYICEAVGHRDMKYRRYALSALGYLRDRSALPTLQTILATKDELYYFRGDALQAIYQIDRSLGRRLAAEYRKEHSYLEMIAKAIDQDAKWLTTLPHEDE